jgi:hypothetical protein
MDDFRNNEQFGDVRYVLRNPRWDNHALSAIKKDLPNDQ